MDSKSVQTIIEIFLFIGAIVGMYVNQQKKNTEFELRLNSVEKQDDSISKKLDKISEDISEIKIELQNKKNRD